MARPAPPRRALPTPGHRPPGWAYPSAPLTRHDQGIPLMTQATYVRTEAYPLGDLTPFPGNAKRGDIPTILESLCRNGQYRSLIVRETEPGALTVLAGNHTLQALAAHGPGPCDLSVRHGEEEHPCALCGGAEWEPAARCEVVTCDDPTARRINLVDNRSSEKGEYDEAALAELLASIGDDLSGTGYTDTDLTDLLTVLEEAAPEEPEDAYAPPAKEDQEEPAPGAPSSPAKEEPAGQAPATPGETSPAEPAPAGPPPPGHRQLVLTYTAEDRDEAALLLSAAREVLPAAETPELILRALRALLAALDSRHDPDGVITVAALLKAAGVEPS